MTEQIKVSHDYRGVGSTTQSNPLSQDALRDYARATLDTFVDKDNKITSDAKAFVDASVQVVSGEQDISGLMQGYYNALEIIDVSSQFSSTKVEWMRNASKEVYNYLQQIDSVKPDGANQLLNQIIEKLK